MHRRLAAQARKKGFKEGSARYDAYVYGTMQKHKGKKR
jgi:hypothetical protein